VNDIALCVTTYKKPTALRGWLESVSNFGRVGVVNVCDDNDGETQEIAAEFQLKFEAGDYPCQVVYSTGLRGGIARNKNRGIKFFLEAPEAAHCKYLVLSDDDIVFTKSEWGELFIGEYFVKSAEAAGLKHVTGYLGGAFGRVNADGSVVTQAEPFFTQFPPQSADENIQYTLGGTQGVLLFFHRELVEKLGYFRIFPGKYGYEHAEYSMRANRIEGRTQDLYPILRNCGNYFHCQNIGNNYWDDPKENDKEFQKAREEIFSGLYLQRKNPG